MKIAMVNEGGEKSMTFESFFLMTCNLKKFNLNLRDLLLMHKILLDSNNNKNLFLFILLCKSLTNIFPRKAISPWDERIDMTLASLILSRDKTFSFFYEEIIFLWNFYGQRERENMRAKNFLICSNKKWIISQEKQQEMSNIFLCSKMKMMKLSNIGWWGEGGWL